MEIDELKNIWKEESELLKSRIELNERLVSKINLDKAVNTFRVFLDISLLGRNLALVYCAISFVVAYHVIEDIHYSVPVVLGGLAMLWSFYHHLAIKKPKDYHSISIIQLQKAIEKFRVHSIKSQYYDFLVVVLWIITLVPVYLRSRYALDIYANINDLFLAAMILIGLVVVLFLFSRLGYYLYDKKLKESSLKLDELIQFEKE